MTEVKIAKIISNGCGIGWADGKTFFVPYTCPGETVRIKSAVKEKSFFYVEDFDILEASPERRKPLCPHYGICGGCSLQHISYPAQLRIKKEIFAELLKQNGITLEIEPEIITPGELGMRTRAKFFALKGKPAYRRKRSNELVVIDECPLLDPVFFDKIKADIAKRRGNIQYEYSKITGGFMPKAKSMEKSVCGKTVKIKENCFFQSSEEGAGIMAELMMREVEKLRPETAADLFCGGGLFSLFLAEKGIKTTGYEIVPDSCASFAENLGDKAEIVKVDAYKLEKLEKRDLVVADPPREGLGKKLSEIVCDSTENVVYIACEPPNLVRDLKTFFAKRFHVKHLYILDLFPDTPHFETVCLLSKLHEAKHHINVKVDMDELDLTSAEAKATYKEIEEWVQENYGFHVTNLNIAQVKQKHGSIERENYNKPKSEDSRQPGCPEEKVKAIEDALRHFQMI